MSNLSLVDADHSAATEPEVQEETEDVQMKNLDVMNSTLFDGVEIDKKVLEELEKDIDETCLDETSVGNRTLITPPKNGSDPYQGISPVKLKNSPQPKVESAQEKLLEPATSAKENSVNGEKTSVLFESVENKNSILGRKQKLKVEEMTSMSDIKVACVLTQDYLKSVITASESDKITTRLDEIADARNETILDPKDKLEFLKSDFKGGVIVVTCNSAKTANFVKLFTNKINTMGIEGLPQIKCSPLKDVTFAPIFTVFYPIPGATFETIKEVAEKKTGLNTDDWKYTHTAGEKSSGGGTKIFFVGNAELAELARRTDSRKFVVQLEHQGQNLSL